MDELILISHELVGITGQTDLLDVIFQQKYADDYKHCWTNLYDLMYFFSGKYKIPQELFERLLASRNID